MLGHAESARIENMSISLLPMSAANERNAHIKPPALPAHMGRLTITQSGSAAAPAAVAVGRPPLDGTCARAA